MYYKEPPPSTGDRFVFTYTIGFISLYKVKTFQRRKFEQINFVIKIKDSASFLFLQQHWKIDKKSIIYKNYKSIDNNMIQS